MSYIFHFCPIDPLPKPVPLAKPFTLSVLVRLPENGSKNSSKSLADVVEVEID